MTSGPDAFTKLSAHSTNKPNSSFEVRARLELGDVILSRKIGFIGLGPMGRPMCLNLIKAGCDLTVYNRSNKAVREVEQHGAIGACSSKEVAQETDIVITMLPDSEDVEQVAIGPEGIFGGIKPGSIYIDMSTISPTTTRKLAEVAKSKGVSVLDAPVSGGEKCALEASLTIMVGGDNQAFKECLPILQAMGKNIVYCGPAGSGQVVKACNQILVAAVLEATSEALVLGQKAGVDPSVVLKVVASGYAMRVLDARGPLILGRDFTPGFKSRLHYKDLGIALRTGAEYDVPLPVTSILHELFGALKVSDRGESDHTAILTILEDLAKTKVEAKSQAG